MNLSWSPWIWMTTQYGFRVRVKGTNSRFRFFKNIFSKILLHILRFKGGEIYLSCRNVSKITKLKTCCFAYWCEHVLCILEVYWIFKIWIFCRRWKMYSLISLHMIVCDTFELERLYNSHRNITSECFKEREWKSVNRWTAFISNPLCNSNSTWGF